MPGPGPPGSAGPAHDGRPTLRFERTYAGPQASAWQAITDTGSLGRWSNQLIDYSGSRLDFTEGANLLFVAKDSHILPALPGRVTHAEPPRLLEYTMAAQVLRWELAPAGSSACRLVLTITADFRGSLVASAPYWQTALDALGGELG
jgi:uncharacterized protein YndB with AHSA1/START domain